MEMGKRRFVKPAPGSVVLWLLVALALVLIVWFAFLKPRPENAVAVPAKAVPVRILTIAPASLRDTVTLPGRVAANISATLSAEKPGRIVELTADIGDAVKQGQVLLRIDSRNWKTLQRQADVELGDAERDLVRWEQMRASGAVADSEYDAIRKRRELAAAAAEQAAVNVDQCTLASPFAGVVDRRLVETGEYVNDGQAVFQLLSLVPLKVLANVPEKDARSVRTGDVARVVVPSLGGAAFEGRVAFLAQEADPVSFTYALEMAVATPPDGLRPGMMVDVEIERGLRDQAIAVPLAAVIPRHGEHVVFVVENNTAVRRVVRLDSVTGREALIGSGLRAGEQLVIEGHRSLQDGVSVQVEAAAER